MNARTVVGTTFAGLLLLGAVVHFQRIANAAEAREIVTLQAGTLPDSWIAGLDCENDPVIQVHAYNDDLYILRQSKCTTFEAPFLYLIFGDERALLLDTGAVITSPVADTVFQIIEARRARLLRQSSSVDALGAEEPGARRPAPSDTELTPGTGGAIPLIVAHSHGHGDHVQGDGQFTGREGVEMFVGTSFQAVNGFWGFEDYPNDVRTFDLGNRVLDVIGTPGHHPVSITLYDRRTGLLLTGDIVYPGHLFVFSALDWGKFRVSLQRLATFVEEHPVTWVLGCHIETSTVPNEPYAWGTPMHPDERRLEFAPSKIQVILDAVMSQGPQPACEIFDEFVIHPVYLCGIFWKWVTAVAAAGAIGTSVAAHPESMSSTRVRVRGDALEMTLRCQVLSLLEVMPELDDDRDGVVTAVEAMRHADRIIDYVGRHSRVLTGADADFAGGVPLEATSASIAFAAGGVARDIPSTSGTIDIERRFVAAAPFEDVLIEMTLFEPTSPDHVDLLAVDWNGEKTEHHALTAASPRARIDGTSRSVFLVFVRLGFRHMLGGWDHLAFLGALILSAGRIRSLLGVVTAFTVAHSISLALATHGVIDLGRHMGFIEAVIALSVAYVATDTLVSYRRPRARWVESFAFGLIHGLGFASFLDRSLVLEPSRWIALLSFNVGVELGQILVAVLVVTLLRVTRRRRNGDDGITTPTVRIVGSAAIAVTGLWWFLQRI